MRLPLWKKWLSYFVDVPVEQAASEWNPNLQVLLSKGRYQLCTAGAIYSHEDLYTNFFLAFAVLHSGYQSVFPKGVVKECGRMYSFETGQKSPFYVGSLLEKVDSVLLLGLGLGSVPWMLERNFALSFRYTAVEIDEAVVYLAWKYALRHLASPMEVVQADARAFVLQDTSEYDLVVMDVFRDAVIPSEFQQLSFLEGLKSRLSPNGILLFNYLAQTPEDRLQADTFFREKFLAVFPEADFLDTGGNRMLMWQNL